MKSNNTINHIAIIMDGNARWAKKNKVNKKQGYIKGLNKIKEIVNLCLENSINYLTIYALSSENINRIDVNIIFKIISENIGFFLDDISSENKVKVKVIGNKDNLPLNINEIINKIEKKTVNNNKLNLNVAFNYGSINELINCINNIINKKKTSNTIVNEKDIRDNLYLPNLPDPEILIRTGGFKRLSNFLLFQLSYTELFFTETLWPDITKDEIIGFFNSYNLIERKYGL